MRTKEQGLLTPADIFMVIQVEDECRKAAHGGELGPSLGCEACRELYDVLKAWFTAHVEEQRMEEHDHGGLRHAHFTDGAHDHRGPGEAHRYG